MPASVSVILPCYNGAGTLRHALTSIVKQTYADWQLILLDDNSTDDSVAIANAFHEPRFRIIEGTDTRGISHRLNDLVAEVDSEYLARMDVDDIMHPQRLQEQVAFLQSHADVDIVGSSIVTIDRLNQVRAWRCPPLRVESPLRILKGEVLYHPAIAGRTSFFKRHPYPTDYTCEDFALWAKSADILTIRNLPAPLLFYREEGFLHLSQIYFSKPRYPSSPASIRSAGHRTHEHSPAGGAALSQGRGLLVPLRDGHVGSSIVTRQSTDAGTRPPGASACPGRHHRREPRKSRVAPAGLVQACHAAPQCFHVVPDCSAVFVATVLVAPA